MYLNLLLLLLLFCEVVVFFLKKKNIFIYTQISVEKGRRNSFEVDLFKGKEKISIWSGN
jgi:hypothetical protein